MSVKINKKNIGLLVFLATIAGFSPGQGTEQLFSRNQNVDDFDDDDELDYEEDEATMSASWLRFGFNPRGASFSNAHTDEEEKLFSFSLEGGAGYRSDRYKWILGAINIPNVNNVDSKTTNTNIAQVELLAKMYLGNLFLSLKGDWGKICSGDNRTVFRNTVFDPPPSATFHSGQHGHVEDYVIDLGYYLKVYAKGKNRFYLAPQGGYQWNFQHWKNENIKPKSALTTPSTDPSGFVQDLHLSYDPSTLKTKWHGPFAGLSFLWQTHKLDVEIGGAYEWLEEHFDTTLKSNLAGDVFGSPVSFNAHNHLYGNFHTRYAYSTFLKLNYHLSSHWLIGLNGSFRQAKTDDGELKDQIFVIVNIPPDPAQTLSLNSLMPSTNRWQSWSAMLTFGYIF